MPGKAVPLNRATHPVPPLPLRPLPMRAPKQLHVKYVDLTLHSATDELGENKATIPRDHMIGPTLTLVELYACSGPTAREPSGSPCGSSMCGGGTPPSM